MKKIIKYEADWCSPCQAYKPTFESVTSEYDNLDVQVINVEEEPEMAQKYSVRSIPTTLILDEDGEELVRISGRVDESSLRKYIDEA